MDYLPILKVFLSLCGAMIAAIIMDILYQARSPTHSWLSAFRHYIYNNMSYYYGMIMHNRFINECKRFHKIQEETLMDRIKQGENTVYGQDHDFSNITSLQDFVDKMPLTTYEDYKPYIDRVCKGEQDVLTKDKAISMLMTTGSTGDNKLFPFTSETIRVLKPNMSIISYEVFWQFPKSWSLNKGFRLVGSTTNEKTECGLPIHFLSVLFRNRNPSNFTSPSCVYDIRDNDAAIYVHLLFALRDSGLKTVFTPFAASLYFMFVFLQENWESLVLDVKRGSLSRVVNIPPEIQVVLNKLLSPMPARAKQLEAEFEKGMDGIAKRIWPNMEVMMAITGGSMEAYAAILDVSFTKGVTLYSAFYGSSEGGIGINLWPKFPLKEYVLVPTWAFYEFIPVEEADQKQPSILMSHQVKAGKLYILVLTNYTGLYRYKLGDVVKVVRFYQQAPVVEFQYRVQSVLDALGEKTPEDLVYLSLVSAVASVHVKLLSYTCAESSLLVEAGDQKSVSRPYYVIFVEIEGTTEMTELSKKADECLQARCRSYKTERSEGNIEELQIQELRTGAFREFRNYLTDVQNASIHQIKIPTVVRKVDRLNFLLRRRKL